MKAGKITKNILKGLLIAGVVCIAASSPYFAVNLCRNISLSSKRKNFVKAKDFQFNNAFYYLKRNGYLNIKRKNHQIYVSLTQEGKKKAGKFLIDDLEIKKPRKWDKKYRILIFDIPNKFRIKRDALRGKLKELGFYKIQQSVWAHPYDCEKEINLLREFFGLSGQQLILITGEIENDKFLPNLPK